MHSYNSHYVSTLNPFSQLADQYDGGHITFALHTDLTRFTTKWTSSEFIALLHTRAGSAPHVVAGWQEAAFPLEQGYLLRVSLINDMHDLF